MPPSLSEPAGQQTVDMEQLQAAYRRLLAEKQALALRVRDVDWRKESMHGEGMCSAGKDTKP